MCASLQALPPELYNAIFQHVPNDERKQIIVSLTRALPRSPIPVDLLYQSIRLTYRDQVALLAQRPLENISLVKEFSLETWAVDPETVVSLVRSFPNLASLRLFIGHDFEPNHIEDLFRSHWAQLSIIGLRFRPYFDQDGEIKLKHSYFDNLLTNLTAWEPGAIQSLSIIQDPYDEYMPELPGPPTRAFQHRAGHFRSPPPNHAQQLLNSTASPLDFASQQLNFDPHRPFASNSAFQPNFAPNIALMHGDPPINSGSPFFVLRQLNTLPPILSSLMNFRFRMPSRKVGKYVFMGPGVLDSMELLDLTTCDVMERDVKYILGRFGRLKHLVLNSCDVLPYVSRASAWAELGKDCALAGVRKAIEREAKLREQMKLEGAIYGQASPGAELDTPSIFVLPRIPSLLSFSATIKRSRQECIAEFERGWAEGVEELRATFQQLRMSSTMGNVRIVKFAENRSAEQREEGVVGLEDAEQGDFEVNWAEIRCPIVCLVNQYQEEQHAPGCGHQVVRDIWG